MTHMEKKKKGPYLVPAELLQLLERQHKRGERERRGGGEGEGAQRSGGGGGGGRRGSRKRGQKREEECVSERVISRKQFTLKPEGEKKKKKKLNATTWTPRGRRGERGEEEEEAGERSHLTPSRIIIQRQNSVRPAGGTHRRLGGSVQGLHLSVGHPHVTGRLWSRQTGSGLIKP